MAKNGSVQIQRMALNKIKIGRNSRMHVDAGELDGLMESIKEEGLLQPIGVMKNGTGFEICYGNRRFMACSKLGMSHIPVIVHDKKKAHDIDIKNLTENIQRRNISLAEAGRYIQLLKGEGLKNREISVRLGVRESYIDNCLKAYSHVPAKFRDDLEVPVPGAKVAPGKINIRDANAIVSAEKSYRLTAEQRDALFRAAKTDDSFEAKNVPKYAAALKRGAKDPLKAVRPTKQIGLRFFIDEDEFDRLTKKYVDEGPFRSIAGLAIAILKGEKNEKIKVIGS
jgi:ParB/RepB/Spo0J family partition protein